MLFGDTLQGARVFLKFFKWRRVPVVLAKELGWCALDGITQ
jgi:hypothetical protein